MSANDLSKSVIFPVGEKFASDHFIGTVWLHMLTPFGSACPIGNVTFEPGCRNCWHQHAGGQILLVTGGRGYYQEWGKPARELHPGDVVEIPANVKHWHGAAKDSWFVHLAIEANPEKGDYLTRKGLDIRTRELITFSMLLSLGGCETQLKGHIHGNVSVGNDKEVLLGAVTQLIPYVGYPRALNAIRCANETG